MNAEERRHTDTGDDQGPDPTPPGRRSRRTALGATVLASSLVAAVGLVAAAARLTAGSAAGSSVSRSAPRTDEWGHPGPGGPRGAPTMPSLPEPGPPGTTTLDVTEATGTQELGMARVTATSTSGEAVGTGMVIRLDGEVVTNHHVVEGATSIEATVSATGRTYPAEVLGTDAKDDIALLRLTGARHLRTVQTRGTTAAVGDAITAVGDANGDSGALTAAEGSITALRRSITVQDAGGATQNLTGLIEVDADVVSGDSGGAIFDKDGDVVGMTTAASTGSAEITGYAIPIAKVRRVADVIDAGKETSFVTIGQDGFLGVEVDDITAYSGGSGTVIVSVLRDTAAAELGLRAGDTITAVDGVHVNSAGALHKAIVAHEPGDKVSVTWVDSSGERHVGGATLTKAPVR